MSIRHLPRDASGWRARALAVAPMAPLWLRAGVGSFLADVRVDSDALLSLADALEEASETATAHGQHTVARELHQLAELPRQLASTRGQTTGQTNTSDQANQEMQHG